MKRILFITGTRADFGKLKPLISVIKDSHDYEYQIFVTGMHLLSRYGLTVEEIGRSGFANSFSYMNQIAGDDMEIILANTVSGLSRFLHENEYDLIVVHGDRVEALAGAIVGAMRNILVAHIEGGEISGTIDELIRHAVTKMSHIHFAASEDAKKRLLQMGENEESIFVIGSADVDIMLSNNLPVLEKVKEHYEIKFDEYAIAVLHPVTTESFKEQKKYAAVFTEVLLETELNYVVIYPNNDTGSDIIFQCYEKMKENKHFRSFSSLRFEYFLTLLKNAKFIIGNSSAGIYEAPVYGVPAFNLGNRQDHRFDYVSIINLPFEKDLIIEAIRKLPLQKRFEPTTHYGDGTSAQKFLESLDRIWTISKQKQFIEIVI